MENSPIDVKHSVTAVGIAAHSGTQLQGVNIHSPVATVLVSVKVRDIQYGTLSCPVEN